VASSNVPSSIACDCGRLTVDDLLTASRRSPPAVLVVDDDASKRVAIRAILAPLGIPVIEVDSGRAALRALTQRTFALILMDVNMPTMNGFETAKLCRQQSEGALTPIIFITAMGSDDARAASAYESGAVDFIFAPFLPEVLRAKVAAFVELFAQSEALEHSLTSITALNAALRDSDLRTQAVLDNVSDGIFILDEAGRIESVNRSVAQLFGYGADELIGHLFEFTIAPERRDELERIGPLPAESRRERGTPRRALETLGYREDGSTFAIELERTLIHDGERTFTLAFVRDVSERKAHTDALEHLALHDGLTGLANRTLFSDHVSRALAAARRADREHALLVMDLNGFKQVNDTLGHDRGDALLRKVAERLVDTLRDGDMVARLGGDEFGVLPGDPTDLSAAAAIAHKLEHAYQEEFVIGDEPLHVSPSIGIAVFPQHGRTTPELLHRADLAMYAAKRSGKGHAVFDTAQEKRTERRLARLLDLRQCVARDELVVHYQPKIDLFTQALVGVEALVRWLHPEHGLLLPGSFMPEVERTNLIGPLTRWVMNEALRQQRDWLDEGLDLTVAVNVAARSLGLDSSLPELVAELTALWGTGRGRLTLEITESGLIAPAAPAVLSRLHAMGERLSIDDFGTGYSSLAYLQRLPVDEIKIDRSFVTRLAEVADDAIIVRSTIDLAHNLGLSVIAEGVEDDGVLQRLLQYGCDGAQGYLFGRPVPADELRRLADPAPAGAAGDGRPLDALSMPAAGSLPAVLG
jgi:diguanylate cyclase (GGDEF)-like protein/PAS domain S-box-containing protein